MCADNSANTKKLTQKLNMINIMCYVSRVTYDVMQHLSPVTYHLTTTLYSFSCYESPRLLGDAGDGGLVIVVMENYLFRPKPPYRGIDRHP